MPSLENTSQEEQGCCAEANTYNMPNGRCLTQEVLVDGVPGHFSVTHPTSQEYSSHIDHAQQKQKD
jgi:hypothetical protein